MARDTAFVPINHCSKDVNKFFTTSSYRTCNFASCRRGGTRLSYSSFPSISKAFNSLLIVQKTMSTRRRDDRPHDDRYKAWIPQDKQQDRPDYDRRRHRSATVPSQTHDSSQPQDTRRSSRAYRQDPHYTTTAPLASHHPPPAPSSSRTFLPPRSSAQNPSAAYHVATPYQASASIQPPQPPHTSKGYSAAAAASSRRAQTDNLDSRSYPNRRGPIAPTPKSSYEHVSSEDLARATRQPYPSRTVQPSTQPMPNATTSSANWTSSSQDAHVKRSKERDKERDRFREAEKERDRERNVSADRYRERYRSDVHREKDHGVENDRHREPSRFRNEKRMESDSEGLVYPDNASKASLSGKEGYQPSVRESVSGHRRQRTEDGPLSSTVM
ncbi:hypothetical protein K503DRAFT_258976 [Rhizopogon vinicolor AM-OR11-026]|uniref:Uncharacterized protein n=1 Tax=Rhizopogon vinicolor AM-OR11-026 TaxID=1314800 RepID=A0A1B7MWR1_9AGAM|nr:hypothetical protein K503DRAFT_258976 [Rhizopogon vinicolor AM-OR11-026]